MKKLMIASPCHHGKVDNKFTLSLIQSLYILDHANIQTIVLLPATGSILAKERNKIISVFMESDCTNLMCIDSDLSWDPKAIFEFLNYDDDILAGVYPARTSDNSKKFIFWPDTNPNNSIKTKNKLMKMFGVPAGFMMITRKCIEKMQNKFPELRYEDIDINGNKEIGYAFFNTELENGNFWGEDYVFCKKATKAGINIFCDPTIEFNHAGISGKLTEILTDKIPSSDKNFIYNTEQ